MWRMSFQTLCGALNIARWPSGRMEEKTHGTDAVDHRYPITGSLGRKVEKQLVRLA